MAWEWMLLKVSLVVTNFNSLPIFVFLSFSPLSTQESNNWIFAITRSLCAQQSKRFSCMDSKTHFYGKRSTYWRGASIEPLIDGHRPHSGRRCWFSHTNTPSNRYIRCHKLQPKSDTVAAGFDSRWTIAYSRRTYRICGKTRKHFSPTINKRHSCGMPTRWNWPRASSVALRRAFRFSCRWTRVCWINGQIYRYNCPDCTRQAFKRVRLRLALMWPIQAF